MRIWIGPLIFATVSITIGTYAHACSSAMSSLELDPAAAAYDFASPSSPTVELTGIWRGRGPQRVSNGILETSCDYSGSIAFRIVSVQDDYSKPIEMGFLMEVVSGVLPIGLRQPSKPIITLYNDLAHGIFWQWNDGATDEQEAFDFVVVVYAVDLAGNVSPPSEPIRVEHPGGKGKLEPNQLMQTDSQQAGRR